MALELETREISPDTSSFFLRYDPGGGAPEVNSGPMQAEVARLDSGVAVFDGHLFNRDALAKISGADPASSAAEIVLRAYLELGAHVMKRVDGVFALVIWDERSGSVLAARDPLGHHPLFYAKGLDGAWYFSDSIAALVRADQVPATLNRPAMAELLVSYHLDPGETYFEAVRRIPAGRALTANASGVTTERYWDPTPNDTSVEWITEADVPHLSTLMERALARALSAGRPSIFLSGGIDSVAVAAYAADEARKVAAEPPIALSLVFPDPNYDEERIQRLVAGELGMPQTVVSFADAEGPDGLVLSSLRTTGSWPTPLVNIWHPLYTHLARIGQAQGAQTILTGAGGDEWLSVSPRWAADCFRGLHFRELYHFWLTFRQSYTVRKWPMLRNLLWKYGAKVVIKDAGRSAVGRVAPERLREIKRQRLRDRLDPWLAPDQELARRLEDRAAAWSEEAHSQGAYLSDVVPYYENVVIAMEREESYERGRRLGLEPFMPLWDPDVVDFLIRTPPRLLHAGHRSKGIMRWTLADRFPTAGFGDQKKVLITDFATSTLTAGIPRAWKEYGGAPILSASGIVDEDALQSAFSGSLARLQGRERSDDSNILEFSRLAHKLWSVLNLESWARQWT